jgi:curved DNA-binding protein CbpA
MSATTHYTTLGLVPSATPEVIRAAYKALALIFHPDRTVHLDAKERASYATVFKQVQAAYDVLGSPALKAAYDAELTHLADVVDQYRSATDVSSKSTSKSNIKLTTPEEKEAMRARARQSLDSLREKRAERDIEEANMGLVDLEHMIQLWKQLAEENIGDPVMRAHCAIRIHEYEQKVAVHEQQHKEWLAKMSTAKHEPSKSAIKQRQTARHAPKPSHGGCNAEQAKALIRAEAERAAAARAEARNIEKARREAARQAYLDQKAAAGRAMREQHQTKMDSLAQIEAERIAKARAKIGAAPRGNVRAVTVNRPSQVASSSSSHKGTNTLKHVQAAGRKLCSACGANHTSLREWRECTAKATSASEDADGGFLRTE